jgi:TP901 family phage tail tape measure protein
MGGDSVAAVDALTTGMLQYGIDLSDPIKAQKEMANMMNVMAAAAQEGAAEVPSISQALKVAGVQAKLSKVSFEGTNAAIQELAKGGKVGAEAGTALRNVLGKMAGEDIIPKEAAGKLRALGVDMSVVSDTSIPFTDRLRELKKAQGDATVMAQVFGVENAAAANILLNSVDAQDALKAKITGTNSAQEQANVIMDTTAERLSRMNAWFDNVKISIGKYTAAAQPFVAIGADSISMMANMANAQKGVTAAMAAGKAMLGIKSLAESAAVIKTKLLSTWTRITTVSQWNLNAAMMANPIGVVVLAIIALVAIIAVAWAKFEGFRNVIFQGWEAMKLFGNVIKDYVINRFKELLRGVTGIGKALLHFFNGEWSKAWETGKNAMVDLSGAGSAGAAIDQVKEGMPGALAKGKSRSAAYTANKNASPEVGAVPSLGADTTGLLDLSGKKKKDPATPAGGTGTAAKENALAIGGTGTGGGSKTINMTLNIVNNFSTSETSNARAMADKVMGHVNDKLRDAVTNLG